jgi:hypothetical protein
MATISKQGIGHKPPVNTHIREDKSFGRASRLLTAPRKPGLNPHNAIACDDPVVDADAAVSAPKYFQTTGQTRH